MTQSPDERYVRESRIATGGMGEVWRARDTVLGREVAVKLLKPEYADDATFRARFDAEARHAAALHHPGIASVFDYGMLDHDRIPFLVMELVDGEPLSDLLTGGRAVDPEQARRLVAQAAEALGAAHDAGVVHRDVKPANLLVAPTGQVKVTDFGIARAVDSVPITSTGQVMGTPQYLSPEQARGELATSASDVYSLGVVLFECLTGHRPFTGETPVATALAHLREDVPDLPDTVPADLAAVVHKAMAKDPAARYPDGTAFAEALRSGTERLVPPPVPPPTEAATGATQVMAAPPAAPVVRTAVTEEPPPPAAGGSRWPWVLAGLLALAVVVLLLVTRPWSDETPRDNPIEPSQTPSATPSRSPRETPSRSSSPSPSSSPSSSSTPSSGPEPSKAPSDSPSASPPASIDPTVTVDPGTDGRGSTGASSGAGGASGAGSGGSGRGTGGGASRGASPSAAGGAVTGEGG